jgi:dihydroorotase
MARTILKDGLIFNRGETIEGDMLIDGERIVKVGGIIEDAEAKIINCAGKWIIPGIIDDQVHFREPGLTHKADIASESKAAAFGGVTSFMEMPNTKPAALSQELLEDKYKIARNTSWTNYSFFMGASNDNIDEVLKTNPNTVCGVKVFMGSSTGNMLVDEPATLEKIFKECPMLIATHCEDEQTIRENVAALTKKDIEGIRANAHPNIRTVQACLLSSSRAVELAKKYDTRLHVLHISTKDELSLFDNTKPLKEKRITSEACVHHLYFTASDYDRLGNQIKCNPAIKEANHSKELLKAVADNRIDIIATDHAPHTWAEKCLGYMEAPSGLPLVQHSINIMMELMWKGHFSMKQIVDKMCHAPADCFRIEDRGYLDEGKYADIVIINPNRTWVVNKANILYKCGWSPLEGTNFKGKVTTTIINGNIVFNDGEFRHQGVGKRLYFENI